MLTTREFVQPAVGKPVAVYVDSSDGLATGVTCYTPFGGYYRCGAVNPGATTIHLTNLGTADNGHPGDIIAASSRIIACGPPGAILEMNFTWIAGVVNPALMGAGIGCNASSPKTASHLYIRGHSGSGGPNPVNLWKPLFRSTNPVKGVIELFQPNSPVWVAYLVKAYETLTTPQVQDFTVELADIQTAPRNGEQVYLKYSIAGDRGAPA